MGTSVLVRQPGHREEADVGSAGQGVDAEIDGSSLPDCQATVNCLQNELAVIRTARSADPGGRSLRFARSGSVGTPSL